MEDNYDVNAPSRIPPQDKGGYSGCPKRSDNVNGTDGGCIHHGGKR